MGLHRGDELPGAGDAAFCPAGAVVLFLLRYPHPAEPGLLRPHRATGAGRLLLPGPVWQQQPPRRGPKTPCSVGGGAGGPGGWVPLAEADPFLLVLQRPSRLALQPAVQPPQPGPLLRHHRPGGVAHPGQADARRHGGGLPPVPGTGAGRKGEGQ